MQLGMVGLGRMGANLSRRLMRTGHEVVAYDVSPEAVEGLAGEGAVGASSLEDFVKNGLFETEIGSRIERFGNVATVRSITESRRTPNGPIDGRYVNYIALYWDGVRWWISGFVWDEERPNNPIPKAWIGVREEAR